MVERCTICGVLLRPFSRPRKATCDRGSCAHEYRKRIWATPGARSCPICGRRIDRGVHRDTCGDAYCAEEFESRLLRKRREQEQLEARRRAAERIEADLRGAGKLPPGTRTAVLPAHGRPLVPLDPTRRTIFAELISGLMEDAAADPNGPTGDAPYPEGPSSPVDTLARSACASCRGLCCKHGEPHAFIAPATLRRYLKHHPEETPAQALEAYLSFIPPVSTAGSCIYHGVQGCALPRAMRSDVCNRFICDDLERLQKPVAEQGAVPPVLAVGFDGDRLVRISLIEGEGVRTLSEP